VCFRGSNFVSNNGQVVSVFCGTCKKMTGCA
jgi:hypothetical protein